MTELFQEHVVLVTGAASAIGFTICRHLVDAGATVIAADSHSAGVKALSLSLGKRIHPLCLDTSDPDEVHSAIKQIVRAHGMLHMVVNHPGSCDQRLDTAQYPLDEWHRVLAVNLHGMFHVMKYAIAQMLHQGHGSIVNVAPEIPSNDWASSAAHVAARHALVGMTRSAAEAYVRQGLRINAVGPGFVDAPLPASLQPDDYAALVGLQPAGHLDSIDKVAALVCSLLLPQNTASNGAYHLVDGAYCTT